MAENPGATIVPWALALWLAWSAAGVPAISIAAGAGDMDPGSIGLWIGGSLVALGLVGGAIAAALDQRRRLQGVRLQLETLNAEFDQRQRRLEALEREIEQHRQSSDGLRDSERRFRGLLEQLPVGVFLADA